MSGGVQMSKEIRILEMLKEVYEDKKTGKKYWFDADSYIYSRDFPKQLSTRDICTKLELHTDINVVSDEAIMKQIRRFNNYVDGRGNALKGDIDFIKKLGMALENNEMAFLIPITLESLERIANTIKIQTTRSDERLYQDEIEETLNMHFNECLSAIKEELEE